MCGFVEETCEAGFEVRKYNIWLFQPEGLVENQSQACCALISGQM